MLGVSFCTHVFLKGFGRPPLRARAKETRPLLLSLADGESKMASCVFCVNSETGLVRKDNQDSVLVSEDGTVFCVADGMGGGSDGALASFIVCEEVRAAVNMGGNGKKALIDRAIAVADGRIRCHAKANGFRQMGSTVAILMFDSADKMTAKIGHIGDSRIYRIRDRKAVPITDDHTLCNQLMSIADGKWVPKLRNRDNPLCHILTKAIGSGDNIGVDWKDVDVFPGDRYLLCSDGVHGVLDDENIARIFESTCSVWEVGERLRKKIIDVGAPDNFSYIIIEIGE